MIRKRYRKHKVARSLFFSKDARLEIVGGVKALSLTYKLTIVFNGSNEVSFFSDNIRELLPEGVYPFSPYTGWNTTAPFNMKMIEQGVVSFEDYKQGVFTSPLIAQINY